MASSRFVIVPSICFETFSMVIVEAFSQGIPVIAPAHGAPAELVTDRKNGLLFVPGDAPSLARAVRELGADPTLLEALSTQARTGFKGIYTEEEN